MIIRYRIFQDISGAGDSENYQAIGDMKENTKIKMGSDIRWMKKNSKFS